MIFRILSTLFLAFTFCPQSASSTLTPFEKEQSFAQTIPSLQLLALGACADADIKALNNPYVLESAEEEAISLAQNFMESKEGYAASAFFYRINKTKKLFHRFSWPPNRCNASYFLDLQGSISPPLRIALKIYLKSPHTPTNQILFLSCLTLEKYANIPFHRIFDFIILDRPIEYLSPLLSNMEIKELTISNCKMGTFPPILAQHPTLEDLKIRKANFSTPYSLKALGEQVPLIKNLKELSFEKSLLPQSFITILKKMENLTKFSLRETQIETGLDGLWPNIPPSVTHLYLCHLELTEIPNNFPYFLNLQNADFRENSIEFYPYDFQNCKTDRALGFYERNEKPNGVYDSGFIFDNHFSTYS